MNKLIIGLGNPEPQYQHHRHNVGYLFVDAIKTNQLPGFIYKKTNVFMNESGQAVKSLYTKYKILNTDLYIAHDDLDIPLGSYKIQFATGPKIHKGLLSCYEALGTNQFWHIRIGVDNRDPQNRTPGDSYVLQKFTPEEQLVIDSVFSKIITELKAIHSQTD